MPIVFIVVASHDNSASRSFARAGGPSRRKTVSMSGNVLQLNSISEDHYHLLRLF